MFESIERVEAGAVSVGVANIVASVLFGLILTYAGLQLGRAA